MFTGIIEETGTIRGISQGRDSAFITVGASKVLEGTVKGDSIAVNGVCLTVTSLAADSFTADAMPETLRRSSLGRLVPGSKVNLERAMQAGGRFGGHIVSGHVDACCRVLSITAAGIAKIVRIAVPEDLSALIAVKGSVAVDGASLTVTESGTDYFAVSLPDLQLWTDDLSARSRSHCFYLMALGYWGLGKHAESLEAFSEALRIDPDSVDAERLRRVLPDLS